jgi:hypothetical protein
VNPSLAMPGSFNPATIEASTPVEDALRELRWLLTSAPLLDPTPGAYPVVVQAFDTTEAQAIGHWLDEIERAPEALSTFMSNGSVSLRIGRRAERLMEFFLRRGPTHRLAAANLPLRHTDPHGDRTTVGEIDFLLHDAAGRPWHWELAVKFFLCMASGKVAKPGDFVGPDAAETLDTKLYKLFDRQLRHQPPPPWNEVAWTPAACTRGRLFYRHDRPPPVMAGLNADHLRGQWVPRARIGELPDAAAPVWHVVPRNEWMCPRSAEGRGHDLATLCDAIDAQHAAAGPAAAASASGFSASPPVAVSSGRGHRPTATMVQRRVDPDGSGPYAPELLFVVPADWPDRPGLLIG